VGRLFLADFIVLIYSFLKIGSGDIYGGVFMDFGIIYPLKSGNKK
jgi:hypothetical protein